jgi:hypothetical protein
MPTFTSSRRAIAATALGLAISLSLVGCSRIAGLDAPSEAVADATLEPSAPPTPASPSPSQAVSTPTPTPAATPDPTYDATPTTTGSSGDGVACSLLFIDGDLVADNGRVILANSREGPPVPLVWPDGWTVRPTDDGQLEVVDDTGTVRTRTGEAIKLEGIVDPRGGGYGPWVRDGELVVCPIGIIRNPEG